MLVKLQTPEYLIYAELDTPERVTHLALKNRIHTRMCYAILREIEQRGGFRSPGASPMTGIPIPSRSRVQIEAVKKNSERKKLVWQINLIAKIDLSCHQTIRADR